MSINITCPTCNARIKAADTAIGKMVKCPKCASPMMIGAPEPEPEPEPPVVVEAQVVDADPLPEEPARRRGRSRREPDDEPPATPRPKKKSNKGLIIGLSVGAVVLVSLCCCGGGAGMYFGGVFDSLVGNDKVTMANYKQLKVGMTMAEIEAIVGSGAKASNSDVNEVFGKMTFGNNAQVQSLYEQGLTSGQVYRWRNNEDYLLILFSGTPTSGGKARYFAFREKRGSNTRTDMNGTFNP